MEKVQQNYWYAVWILAKTDFKLRYNGSWLGVLWVVLKPLFIFSILNFVFSHLFGSSKEYSLSLLTGLILWNYFAEGTSVGLTAILSKAHIITKVNLPKWIIVFSATLNSLLTFLLNLCILIFFFIWYGASVTPLAVLISLSLGALTFLWVVGFAFLVSPVFLKFRDLNQIWEVILTAGFYAAPIIYPISTIPENFRWLLYLNPMTFILVQIKNLVFLPTTHDVVVYVFQHLQNIIIYCVVLLVFMSISFLFFHRQSRAAAEFI